MSEILLKPGLTNTGISIWYTPVIGRSARRRVSASCGSHDNPTRLKWNYDKFQWFCSDCKRAYPAVGLGADIANCVDVTELGKFELGLGDKSGSFENWLSHWTGIPSSQLNVKVEMS